MRQSLTWEDLLNSSTDPFSSKGTTAHNNNSAGASGDSGDEPSISGPVGAGGSSMRPSPPTNNPFGLPDIRSSVPVKRSVIPEESLADPELLKQQMLQLRKDRTFLLPETVQTMSLGMIMFAYCCVALRPFAAADFQQFFYVVIRTITQFAVPLYFYNSGRLHALSDESMTDSVVRTALYRLVPGVIGALIMVPAAAFISANVSPVLGVPYTCTSTPAVDISTGTFLNFLNNFFVTVGQLRCYGFSWLWLFVFEFFLIAGNAPFCMWIRMSYFRLHTSPNHPELRETFQSNAQKALILQAIPFLIMLGLLSAWQQQFAYSWLYTLFTYLFFFCFVSCTIRGGLRGWLLYGLNIPSMLPCMFLAVSTEALRISDDAMIPISFTYFNLIFLQGALDQTYHEDHKLNLRKNPWTFLPFISITIFGMVVVGSPTIPMATQSPFTFTPYQKRGHAFLFVLGAWAIIALMHRWSSALFTDWSDVRILKQYRLKDKFLVVYFVHGVVITGYLYGVIHSWGIAGDDSKGAFKLGVLLMTSFQLVFAMVVVLSLCRTRSKGMDKYPLTQVELPKVSLPQMPKLGLKKSPSAGIGKPGDFDETLLD